MANNKNITKLRERLCSGLTMNSIPKYSAGTIIVPYYKSNISNYITEIVPYYIGVKSKEINVVAPRFKAPPRKGSICFTQNFFNTLSNKRVNKLGQINEQEQSDQSTTICSLIITSYNTALLLKFLNDKYQHIFNFDEKIYSTTIDIINKNKDRLITNGRLSVVMEPSAGHVDNYDGISNNKQQKLYIESKMTLSVGTRQKLEVPKNEINFIHNVVPPASLAYPRFGIYTNCSPIYDIECHCLHNTVHVQNNNITNDNRGSVVTNFFNNSPNHYYYKEGIAITYVPIHK